MKNLSSVRGVIVLFIVLIAILERHGWMDGGMDATVEVYEIIVFYLNKPARTAAATRLQAMSLEWYDSTP